MDKSCLDFTECLCPFTPKRPYTRPILGILRPPFRVGTFSTTLETRTCDFSTLNLLGKLSVGVTMKAFWWTLLAAVQSTDCW